MEAIKKVNYYCNKYKLKTLNTVYGAIKNRICNCTPRQKSIRALEIFRVQKLILNATS